MLGFTYYRQFDEMDCGAACLRMVTRSYGRDYPLEFLRELTRVGRDGVSLLGISEGAEEIGLQTLALQVTADQLAEEIPLPCILPWRGTHFVVLYRVKNGQFSIADPDPLVGKREYGKRDLVENWSHEVNQAGEYLGHVLVLEPTPGFSRPGESNRPKGLNFVVNYLLQYRSVLVNLGVGLTLSVILQLAFIVLLRNLVDYGVVLSDLSFIYVVLFAQAILIGSSVALEWIRHYLLSHLGGRIGLILTSNYVKQLLRLPLDYFNRRSRADLLQRVYDHDRLQSFISGDNLIRLFGLLNFIAFCGLLAVWQLELFVIFLLGTGAYLGWIYYVQRRRKVLVARHFDQMQEGSEQLGELIDGIREVKVSGIARQKRWEWEGGRAEIGLTRLALAKLDRRRHSVGGAINHSKNLMLSLSAALFVVDGSLTLGALVAIHYLMAQLDVTLFGMGDTLTEYSENSVAIDRIDEGWQSFAKSGNDPQSAERTPLPRHRVGDIDIRELDFRYNVANAPRVLTDIELTIPAGKVTALVGPSGSGKTTLLSLLLGLYEPSAGRITVAGKDLAHLDGESWRADVGVVNQDGYLFSDTIERNIHLSRGSVDRDELRRVMEVTQLAEWVDGLSHQGQTRIGAQGRGCSRGQQQRLLLARAIYGKPNYLFLDEAMAGLDAFAETALMDNLLDYLKGTTILLVAHRRTTFERADKIIVLEEGRVAEAGHHRELMRRQQGYYRLVRHQQLLGS